jgi:hypothetical protein
VRFTERLDEIGARPSIGTVADSFDCEDPVAGMRGFSVPLSWVA